MSEAERAGTSRQDTRQDKNERLLAGRYRLGEVLGRGGMGTVWRAEDETLGRTVAVKELRFPSSIDEDEKRRLITRTLREAKAIARIRNTSAVTVFDVVDEDDRPWIVMELVEGKSLAEAIREDGLLEPRRAAEVGLAILDVLRSAHRQGILHRDVKPSNVLIAEDGRVVLTDFGIAQVEGDPSITSTGMLVGAPSYISPERARGHKPGPAADLWSLGGLLYAAVEGAPPYDKGSAIATLTAVMTEPLEEPKNAGPLKDVIYGLLNKDPAQRLDDAGARAMLNAVIHAPEPKAAEPEPVPAVDATRVVPLPAQPGPAEAGGKKSGGGGSAGAERLRGALRSMRKAAGGSAGAGAATSAAAGSGVAEGSAPAPATSPGSAAGTGSGKGPGSGGASTPVAGKPGGSVAGAGAAGAGTGAVGASGKSASGASGASEARGSSGAKGAAAGGAGAASAGSGAVAAGSRTPGVPSARAGGDSGSVTRSGTSTGAGAAGGAGGTGGAAGAGAAAGSAAKVGGADPGTRDLGAQASDVQASDVQSSGLREQGLRDSGTRDSGTHEVGTRADNSGSGGRSSGWPVMTPPDLPPRSVPRAPLTDVVPKRTLVIIAVVFLLAVIGVVLAFTLGGGDDSGSKGSKKNDGGKTVASASASASAGTDTKKDDGDKASTGGAQADSSATASASSGTSSSTGKNASGGSGTETDGSSDGAAVVKTYKGSQGFSIGLPAGWSYQSTDSAGVRLVGPDGQKLLIAWTSTPKGDPVADWKSQEQYMTRSGYTRIRIAGVSYRGWNTADWEFTYEDGGTKYRTIDRGFVVNSHLGYALMYTAKAANWDSELRKDTWTTLTKTFEPKS
ncbi:serine/threonine protein kinase [Streptomyces sp. NBC_01478]|uniref:serine/threonine-protein kinase n=1 Tax=Streptomyces sp. NBC_01478 TaxID=2903882 RepID=UPI002E33948A|nr:serine/threonine-protein kinase [Streptomyces sp. NBC_01478]